MLLVTPPAFPALQLQVYATLAKHKTELPRALMGLIALTTERLSGMAFIIGRAARRDANIVLEPAKRAV